MIGDSAWPPPGFTPVASAAGGWIVRADCAAVFQAGEADRLLAAQARQAPGRGSGRAEIRRFRIGGRAVVGKAFLHGGLLGPILGGAYWGRSRLWGQIALASHLESHAIPTPRVMAAGSRPLLAGFWRLALITEEVPGGRDLLEVATCGLAGPARRRLVEEVADLVRRLHDAGFRHADLNLSNLVIAGAGGALHVVDLDRGRVSPRLGHRARAHTLARLMRSCDKWLPPDARPCPRDEIRFLRRYARGDRVLSRRLRDLLARARRRHWIRRLGRPVVSGQDAAGGRSRAGL